MDIDELRVCWFASFDGCCFQGLIKVINQVLHCFKSDGQANVIRSGTCLKLLIGSQLRMGRAGRMDDERLGVTDIRQV